MPQYTETELESKIIDHLQTFLLELGNGFAFIGRQVRFTFEEEHFLVDLVFYNRFLKCFVLFDLKIGELKHQDNEMKALSRLCAGAPFTIDEIFN